MQSLPTGDTLKGVKRRTDEAYHSIKLPHQNVMKKNESKVRNFKCNNCCKYFTTNSLLRTHLQTKHNGELSKSFSKNVDTNLIKIAQTPKQVKSCSGKKKLKAYKKIAINSQCEIQVTKETCQSTDTSICKDECVSTETASNSQSMLLHDTIAIKQEPLDHDNISNLDLLVPKIELEISENEINTDLDEYDSNEYDSSEYKDRLGFKCPFCNLTTEYKSVFQRHLRLANVKMYEITSNNPNEFGNTYSCSTCKTNFSNQIIYQHHMKTHKLVACEVCNHSYSYECELVKHQYLKYHNMNCFQCHLCNESFNTENLLKEHLISFHETSDIKFMCILCRTVFCTKSEMLNHCTILYKNDVDINLEDGIFRPFKLNCNPCDAISCSQNSFMIQIGVKKLSKFFCLRCDYQYSSIYYLNQHFLSAHGNNLPQDTRLSNSHHSSISDTLITNYDEHNSAAPSALSFENNIPDQQNIVDIEQVCIKIERQDEDDNCDHMISEPSNFTPHTEFIIPDTTSDFILPDLNHEPEFIPSLETSHKERRNSNSILLKKQSKVKTIQLKVNNTTSQICSVDVKNNTSIVPVSVNKRLANFFENNVNNIDDIEKTTLVSNTISVAPSTHHKKMHDKYWCNACQCSVNSDHMHSDVKSETLQCHKCKRVFSSFVAIKRHFKTVHLRRNSSSKPSKIIDKPKTKTRDRKITYHSTPKNFANPCVETSMVILQENCVPKQSAKNSCEEHHFFYCSLCDTVYEKYEVYTDHFSIHDLKRPFFKCVICDKIFTNFKVSLLHFKRHTETQVNCVSCHKDVSFNMYFDEHIKTCLSKQCSFCPSKIIEDIKALQAHSKSHTTESNNVFECKICSSYFYTQYNFKNHFSNIHSNVSENV